MARIVCVQEIMEDGERVPPIYFVDLDQLDPAKSKYRQIVEQALQKAPTNHGWKWGQIDFKHTRSNGNKAGLMKMPCLVTDFVVLFME